MMAVAVASAGRFKFGCAVARRGWIQRRDRHQAGSARNFRGECSMSGGLRYDRILAGTALALVLAAPLGAHGQTPAPAMANAAAHREREAGRRRAEDTASRPAGGARPRPRTGRRDPAGGRATPPPHSLRPRPCEPAAAADERDRAARGAPIRSPRSIRPTGRSPKRCATCCRQDRPIFASKKERAAVEAFYQNRNLAPLWFDKGVVNARAKAVIARIKQADSRRPRSQATTRFPTWRRAAPTRRPKPSSSSPQTVITFARHLQAGRFPYTRISGEIELPQEPPDMAAVLDQDRRRRRMPATRSTSSARRTRPTRRSRPSSPSCAARPPRKTKVVRIPDGADCCVPAWRTRACRCCASGSTSPATRPISATTTSSSPRSRRTRRAPA